MSQIGYKGRGPKNEGENIELDQRVPKGLILFTSNLKGKGTMKAKRENTLGYPEVGGPFLWGA